MQRLRVVVDDLLLRVNCVDLERKGGHTRKSCSAYSKTMKIDFSSSMTSRSTMTFS